MLLRDILERNDRIHPNRTALSLGSEDVTYRELARRARRYASSLRALGVRRGDRVAVLTHSTPLYVELLFAVPELGAVLIPLNHLLIARELKAILLDAGARILLFEAEFETVVDAIRPGLPPETRFLCVDRPLPAYAELASAARGAGARAPGREAAEDGDASGAGLPESDVALQVYTNGPSGRPVGAMLTHRNLLSASASAAIELGLSRHDVFLSCSPLPFIAGTGRLLRYLFVGGTVVLPGDFDPGEALRAIERKKITHALFTPTMISRILDLPDAARFNLATLRKVLYGGASVPVDLIKRAIRFFGCDMVQSYGVVESAGVLTFLHPEDHSLEESAPYMRKLTSVGKEAIGVEVRVVDDGGREIAPDQVGEMVARGPNIFEGYYRDSGLTAEVLRNGWLRTGDIASVDDEGYIYIVDRKRDALMVGGIPVFPRELENVIAEHPAVSEAAVVGRPDYVLGEIPVAIIALKKGAEADRESILAHCRGNMAPFKVPHAVEFISSLPRNSQGKVLKVKLKERMVGRLRY